MEIKTIENRSLWEEFLMTCEDYTFLQSWDWGEINKKMGEKIWRLGLVDGEVLLGICMAFTINARRGKMLFVPHGPLLKNFNDVSFKKMLVYLTQVAKDENCVCLRISPWLEESESSKKLFGEMGFSNAPSMMHAEYTWLVNLKGSEEEVMGRMRKTTRNLIRRAEREGVLIEKSQDVDKVDDLYRLQMEVVKRNNFVPFSRKYLRTEMEQFFSDDRAILFLGSYEGKVYGAALIVFVGKFAYYYQSGSGECKVPVNYLLQWEVLKEARGRGAEIYNMWGIAPENKLNHPWRGLTTFKTGFGGQAKQYMHAQDLVLSPKYWLTYLIEKMPKTWRQKKLRGSQVQ